MFKKLKIKEERGSSGQRRAGSVDLARRPLGIVSDSPELLTAGGLMYLQRTAGNQAVADLVGDGRAASLQRDVPPAVAAAPGEVAQQDAQALSELSAGDPGLGIRISVTQELLALLQPGTATEPTMLRKHRKTYEYKPVPRGGAFVKPISPGDVGQGELGDCYLLSAMAAIARANPDAIKNLIKNNGDGTYDVTIYEDKGWFSKKYQPRVVTVSATFPTAGEQQAYAQPTKTIEGNAEIWPLLIEKAYAVAHGGYNKIVGGWGSQAMETLSGKISEKKRTGSFSSPDDLGKQVKEWLDKGQAVTAASEHFFLPWKKRAQKKAGVIGGHEYSVISVDLSAKTVNLQNPWGFQHLMDFPLADFQKHFDNVSTNPTK